MLSNCFYRQVNISLYNQMGQKVAQLVNARLSPGQYQVRLNASNLSAGIYLYSYWLQIKMEYL